MWWQLARYWGNLSRGSCYLIWHEFYPLPLLVAILASMRPSNSTHTHPNNPSAPHIHQLFPHHSFGLLRSIHLSLNSQVKAGASQALSATPSHSSVPQKSQAISIIGRHGVSLLHATYIQLELVDKKNTAAMQR